MQETKSREWALYTDGGVIGPNPSSLGGTWCWCLVNREDEMMTSSMGIVEPADIGLPQVTNNLTELYAALRALKSVPKDWSGTVYTDSKITMHRLLNSISFNGIPEWLSEDVMEIRRFGKYRVVLLGGHPTKAELERGRRKDGALVSIHNVFCDLACQRLAKQFKENL